MDLELVVMRYCGYKISIDLFEPCSCLWILLCYIVDVPLNKENSAEIYSLFWFWEVFKVGVALPGRVDTWGVTVGIRAGFRSLGVKII
jgi:hypothetical protein